MCVCVYVCVRACVRACVHVRACVSARVSQKIKRKNLGRFRGRVGYLSRRESDVGWHVFFPDIKEESFFFTKNGASMLTYAAESKDEIPQAHIYLHQVSLSLARSLSLSLYVCLCARVRVRVRVHVRVRVRVYSGGSSQLLTFI